MKISIWLNNPTGVNKSIWSDLRTNKAKGLFSNRLDLTFMLHSCIRSSGHFWLPNKNLILGCEERLGEFCSPAREDVYISKQSVLPWGSKPPPRFALFSKKMEDETNWLRQVPFLSWSQTGTKHPSRNRPSELSEEPHTGHAGNVIICVKIQCFSYC